jgi:hypothetical protein
VSVLQSRLDVDGFFRALDRLEDRLLVGAVDGSGCVELLFEGSDAVLVSIHIRGLHSGRVVHGGVDDTEGYATAHSGWRRWGVRS